MQCPWHLQLPLLQMIKRVPTNNRKMLVLRTRRAEVAILRPCCDEADRIPHQIDFQLISSLVFPDCQQGVLLSQHLGKGPSLCVILDPDITPYNERVGSYEVHGCIYLRSLPDLAFQAGGQTKSDVKLRYRPYFLCGIIRMKERSIYQ